ncbi:FAD-dependent oxidoreductase [Pseudomonas sp.]|uniref:NAD(P)/FAD-dependent oxidoreductase n=1 Tax=Pseudomonas sp. TaxID=306 RepID=UPI00262D32E3|nr:FAD-dependent oxidoreductase [Pseudomonas sp.]
MNTSMTAMVIVGAGQAGGRAALTLREQGYAGRIVLIGNEVHLPYERPPLSKGLLQGQTTLQACSVIDDAALDHLQIEHLSAMEVVGLEPEPQRLTLANGTTLHYAQLLLATGGYSRTLPLDKPLAGIHYLRTYDDALQLRTGLQPGTNVLIVGGGFIGLEVAATARELGCEVTVLEAGSRLAARALPERMSEQLLTLHRNNGVRVLIDTQIEQWQGETRIEAVLLNSGEHIACDLVVVGIGMTPNLKLAQQAGLEVGSGIRVNQFLQTSSQGIYAAGDVCEFPHNGTGVFQRQETWRNADTQGRIAALNMLGQQQPYVSVPWFWSDQYGFGLQTVGSLSNSSNVIEREVKGGGFVLMYLNDDQQLLGACGWGPGNSIAKDIKLCERLIENAAVLPVTELANASTSLKQFARS